MLPVGQLELLPGCLGIPEGSCTATHMGPRFMALDGAALENLEVLLHSPSSFPDAHRNTSDHCAACLFVEL